jgi:hypothetical protein
MTAISTVIGANALDKNGEFIYIAPKAQVTPIRLRVAGYARSEQ